MLRDARRLAHGATLETDVCIVGAGPAGLALALELRRSGRSALILEGGSRFGGAAAQELYRGETRTRPPLDLAGDRFRGLGGTTSRWTGRCLPLTALDFEGRPLLPGSGWPFGMKELAAPYARAAEILGLAAQTNEERWRRRAGNGPFAPHLLELHRAEVRRGNLARRHGSILRGAARIEVWLRAHAVELETTAGGERVEAMRAATLAGSSFRVRARDFVLAAGGLENPRLLLASGRNAGPGLGNRHDLVGRYFMEHAYVDHALLTPLALVPPAVVAHPTDGSHGVWSIAPELARDEGLLQAAFYLRPSYDYQREPRFRSPGILALRELAHAWIGRRPPDRPVRTLWTALRFSGQGLRVALARRGRKASTLLARFVVEAAPDPAHRVTLSDELDPLGMPRLRVEWSVGAAELRACGRLLQILAAETERMGGKLERLHRGDGWVAAAEVGRHHMGTTRMHEDPRLGVTDPDARVHGLRNLWIAGSSLFPTSGFANPTLTIVALAARLARRLTR